MFFSFLTGTPLTGDILGRDKDAYVESMSNYETNSIAYILLGVAALIFILMIACIVSSVIGGKKGNKTRVILGIVGAVLLAFGLIPVLGAGALAILPSMAAKEILDKEVTVETATIESKSIVESSVSHTGRGTTITDYNLICDNGELYKVPEDVYERAEVGQTYYFGIIGDYHSNCFNIYSVDEYEYPA